MDGAPSLRAGLDKQGRLSIRAILNTRRAHFPALEPETWRRAFLRLILSASVSGRVLIRRRCGRQRSRSPGKRVPITCLGSDPEAKAVAFDSCHSQPFAELLDVVAPPLHLALYRTVLPVLETLSAFYQKMLHRTDCSQYFIRTYVLPSRHGSPSTSFRSRSTSGRLPSCCDSLLCESCVKPLMNPAYNPSVHITIHNDA